MKTIALFSCILSSSLFAGELSTYCQTITINPEHHQAQLTLSKDGTLNSPKAFEVSVTDTDYNEIAIDGIKATLLKSTLIDNTTKTHYGLGNPITTKASVYGVKLHVSANQSIGSQVQGCIMRPVNEMEVYTICTESESTFGRQ